jgi:hypothetical protein
MPSRLNIQVAKHYPESFREFRNIGKLGKRPNRVSAFFCGRYDPLSFGVRIAYHLT